MDSNQLPDPFDTISDVSQLARKIKQSFDETDDSFYRNLVDLVAADIMEVAASLLEAESDNTSTEQTIDINSFFPKPNSNED